MTFQVVAIDDLSRIMEEKFFPRLQSIISEKKSETKDDFLSVGEVCSLLKVGRSTLWRWTKEKAFAPSYEIGNRVYYKRSEIEAYLEQNKAE